MNSDKIFADFKVSSKYRTYLYLSISAFYVHHFAFLQEVSNIVPLILTVPPWKKGQKVFYLPNYAKNGASTIGKSFF